ncbi:AAA family ATPase [Vagococcus hydrophili]|uniref:Nuclease SbcCD subunit C n=1 Tax=Vagococcus hydrophili TaxID=2714947 RepID=A0A6G8AVB9_9ENTE|nr:AAA family ATPase [Vagococcus hydrophili]QIL48946.1 AAA family ATPase [Vagococcus hydrophili]
MRIERVSICNFKNIEEETIIDFQKDISILVGPNGFGKTTIFDAIELALTGTIDRISSSGIADGRSAFEKTYFQNNPNEDVVIKLLLSNEKNEYLTIFRFYLEKNNVKRKIASKSLAPTKSLDNFRLIVKKNKESFSSNLDEIDYKNISSQQLIIDEFLGFKNETYKIKDIYNLFNYIQQENTDYYLKKNEVSRKNTLNFLLQIQDYQNKKDSILKVESQLKIVINNLKEEKKKYKDSKLLKKINYEKLLLSTNIVHKFNEENIDFEDTLEKDRFEKYMDEVNKLIEFRENFSPNEYSKKKQSEDFKKNIVNNNEMLKYLLFEKLIRENNQTITNNNQMIQSESNVERYLLENFIDKESYLEKELILKDNIDELKSFINMDIEKINIEKISKIFDYIYVEILDISFLKEFVEFNCILKDYQNKRQQQDSTETNYSDLSEFRRKIKKYKLPDDEQHSKCVFCGYDWETEENLVKEVKKITKIIEETMSTLDSQISDLVIKLESKIKILNKKIENITDKIIILDLELMKKINTKDVSLDYSEFKKLVTEKTSITQFEFKNIDLDIFYRRKEELKELLKKELVMSSEIYTKYELTDQNKQNLEKSLKKYPIIDREKVVEWMFSEEDFPINEEKYIDKKEQLKKYLTEMLTNIMKYDSIKSNDPYGFFEKYFSNEENLFEECSKEKLILKKKYIEYKYEEKKSLKLKKIDTRLKLIKKTYEYTIDRRKELNLNITDYQQQMINMIKLPFFLYTAKILQNYQQGMGVLLTIHEDNSNIRFLTNSESRQDAMYQLSSGQIAVISFAFTLSLNKVFNISDELKILTIDDPIQDMDAMNVHSLIDLLRHSLPDYQIIISTHSDTTAMFIKYKFDLMSELDIDKVDFVNVREVFFEKNNAEKNILE